MKTLPLLLLLLLPSQAYAEGMPLLWPAANRPIADQLSNIPPYAAVALDSWHLFTQRDDLTWKQALGCQALKAVITLAAVGILKKVVHRERFDHSDFNSFPSGHTAQTMAFSGWNYKVGVPMGAVVGALRNGAGKHYLTDVLAGAGIGLGVSLVCRE